MTRGWLPKPCCLPGRVPATPGQPSKTEQPHPRGPKAPDPHHVADGMTGRRAP